MTNGRVPTGEHQAQASSILLEKLKSRDDAAWQWLVHIYGPLVSHWCRRSGLPEEKIADIGQEIFRSVSDSINEFHTDRGKASFHRWFRDTSHSRLREYLQENFPETRETGSCEASTSTRSASETMEAFDTAYDDDMLILMRRATDFILDSCTPENRKVFLSVVGKGEAPMDVARSLGVSVASIHLTKSEILRRIREQFGDLLDL